MRIQKELISNWVNKKYVFLICLLQYNLRTRVFNLMGHFTGAFFHICKIYSILGYRINVASLIGVK